jgi:23S rRNA pseudouridine2605 synthase
MSPDRDPFVLPGDEPPVGDKLQKFLSAAGVASRRHAEVLIQQGRVTVNGKVAQLGMRVVSADRVCVNGVEVGPQAPRYFVLNKPTGVVTTMDDPQGRPTVASLVPDDVRVYPVGRLDIDTSGLLLLTNEGELAHRLMHPSFGVEKTYRVLVSGRVSAGDIRRLAEGVELDDGMTSPAIARKLAADGDRTMLELTIHEGRNRQVRRMCDAVGHHVQELVRIGYGPLVLGDLKPGVARALEQAEIRKLRKAAGMNPPRKQPRESKSGAASAGELADDAVKQEREHDAPNRGNANKQQHSSKRGGAAAPGRGGGGSGSRSGNQRRGRNGRG